VGHFWGTQCRIFNIHCRGLCLFDRHSNEVLAMETQMFDKFLKHIQPKTDGGTGAMAGRAGETAATASSRMDQGTVSGRSSSFPNIQSSHGEHD